MADQVLIEAQADDYTAKWVPIIAAYEREAEKWEKRSIKIIKRYKDDRGQRDINASRYNILWSNVETLKPALFARVPKADVKRRFDDKDPVGRVAADVLERSIDYFLQQYAFGAMARQCVLDFLLPGRGTAWVRYVPHMRDLDISGTQETEDDGPQVTEDADLDGETAAERPEEVYYEEVLPDYVHWQDFGHTDARTWEEVTAVWRKVYLTRSQLIARFGKKIGAAIQLDFTPKGLDGQKTTDQVKKATVYEIWDRDSKKAIWISKFYPEKLDVRDDPLKLDRFFPCPRPLYATLGNDSIIPVPDYVEYQDQANELDELTARIASITKAVKVSGVYDAAADGVQQMFNDGHENQLIPVSSWAMFAEKGGLKGSMELLPIQEISQTLMTLYECRDKVKQDLYEITGMSDILRGATNPNETFGAQKIKQNFVTMRLDERQRAVARFCRGVVEIVGQIIAMQFSLDTIKQISGVKLLSQQEKELIGQQQQLKAMQAQQMAQPGQAPIPPPALSDDVAKLMSEPSWDEVCALLKDEPARCFRLDLETDSTVQNDEDMEKQNRMEFLTTIGGFMEKASMAPPALAPLMGELLMFAVRAFPVGKSVESSIQAAVEKLNDQAKNPAAPPPNPDQIKAQASLQQAQMSAQVAGQTAQLNAQSAQQLAQLKAQSDEQMEALKQQAENQRKQMELAHQAQQADAEREHKAQLALMQQQAADAEAQRQREFESWQIQFETAAKIEIANIGAAVKVNDTATQAATAEVTTEEPEVKETKPDPIEKMSEMHGKTMEALGGVMRALSAPRKRVIERDPTGKAIGMTETIEGQ